MSSVSASDRNRQNDELRSQREEYNNRETEAAKRQKKEIKRILARHDQEVQDIKDTYETQISSLKDRSNKALSEKDVNNQAKIDKLRSMYTESLRKKTEESDTRRDAELHTLRSQIDKNTEISEKQKEILRRNFADNLAERDRQMQDTMTRSREGMQEAIGSNTERLSKRHRSEMDAVTYDRDKKLGQAEKDMGETRSVYENRLKDSERQSRQTLDRTEENWENTYNNKQNEMNELLTGQTEALKLAREKIQGRYQKSLQDKMNQMDSSGQVVKDQITSRLASDVRSAENENKKIKNDHIVEMMTTKRVRDLEKGHVVAQYEDRIGKIVNEKDGLIKKANEVNRDKLVRVNDLSEDVLRESTVRNKNEARIMKERHQEARAQMEMESKSQIDHLSNTTGDRVEKLMKATNQSQVIQQKQHKENLTALKMAYADELGNQREAQTEQLKNTYMRMDQRLKETEVKMTKRLEETVGNYETKLSEIKDNYEKELKKQSEAYESRLENQKKVGQTEQKSQDIKFDMKLSQLQEQHDKEVDRLQKRHQEQMASLSQKLSYYRKS